MSQRVPRSRILILLAVTFAALGAAQQSRATIQDSPRFIVETQDVVDTPSSARLLVQQNDLEDPFLDHRVHISPGWRFGGPSIRQSDWSSCKEFGDLVVNEPSQLATNHMEAVGWARLLVSTNDTRNRPAGTTDPVLPPPPRQNYALYDDNGSAGSERQPASIWFLRWDAATNTAILCARVKTADPQIDAAQQVIVFQIELHKNADSSWDVSFDLNSVPGQSPPGRSITDNPYFTSRNVSVQEIMLTLNSMTGGNYNLDTTTGARCSSPKFGPCQRIMSMTPVQPGFVDFGAHMSPCLPVGSCAAVVRNVTRPVRFPSVYPHESGRLSGPVNVSTTPPVEQTGRGVGFGLIRGSSEATITWTPPGVGGTEQVRGYVLTVARTGDQDSRHFEYLVTDPVAPDFDTRQPCGPDGAAASCSLTLSFPLSTVGGDPLDVDGIYDVSLVTVYADGHRTDQRCDDGSPEGIVCPASEPKINVVGYGISTLRLIMRSKAWPLAFQSSGTLLTLLDFSLRQGEVIVLGGAPFMKHDGPYFATSSTIAGDNAAGGIAVFGSPNPTGNSIVWRFDGTATPALLSGTFTLYHPNGLPGSALNPSVPNGPPPIGQSPVWVRTFSGSAVANP